MNRREPGFLIPAQRRCEHLWSVAVRNLCAPADSPSSPPPSAYYTLAVGDAVVYRSEIVEYSANPTWLPMEWQYVHLEPSESALLKAPAVRLSIWTAHSQISWRTPQYFPSTVEGGGSVPGAALLLDVPVDLRDLQFLAFDLLDVLSQVRPVGEGGRGKEVRPDTSELLPPEAVGFQLDALPTNLLVFWLDDGHYVTPDAHRLLRGGGGDAAGAPKVPVSAPSTAGVVGSTGTTARLDLRRAFDASNRLMQLRRDTLGARAATVQALSELRLSSDACCTRTTTSGDSTTNTTIGLEPTGETAQLVLAARRVADLRSLSARLCYSLAREEALLSAERASLTARSSAAASACGVLRRVEALLPVMDAKTDDARAEVSLLRNLVSAKQLSLLAELRTLYPIVEVERGRRYTIRGIALPDRDLTSLPEEQVSTALGYTCHTVQLASKYLGVPLRYTPCHMASRSTMRDEAVVHARDFPLFWKGATQEEFAVAVILLQRDIRQLLFSQGVAITESHMLGSLQRLMSLLLDTPLPY